MFKNAMWIISCKIVQAVLGLVVSMMSARYLGPSNYGLISYAASIVTFAVPIMQLGLRSTLVQEFIQNPDEEGKTLGTALVMNIVSAIACILGIMTFVSIVNRNETDTLIVCTLYSLNLIFQAMEMVAYWFQSKLLSKYTSLTMLFAYFAVSSYKIYLLITQKGIYWFAISQAIDYFLIAVCLWIIYRRLGGQSLSFSFVRAKEMFARSRHYIVSGLMVTIFQQTDRLMLKLMLGDAATGYYSAAVTCACMTSFVYAAIIDSMRPVILKKKIESKKEYVDYLAHLNCLIIYISLAQGLVMTVFSKPIIYILYGEAYAPASDALKIVVWFVTYSYLGSVRNIWILAENKQKYLWVINLTGAVMNVALNLVLIPIWGICGASIASVATQIFTNFVLGFILIPIKENNGIILKGLKIEYLKQDAIKVFKMIKR